MVEIASLRLLGAWLAMTKSTILCKRETYVVPERLVTPKVSFAALALSNRLPRGSLQVSPREYAVLKIYVVFDVAEIHLCLAAGLEI
jgi:hypothetical protein